MNSMSLSRDVTHIATQPRALTARIHLARRTGQLDN